MYWFEINRFAEMLHVSGPLALFYMASNLVTKLVVQAYTLSIIFHALM